MLKFGNKEFRNLQEQVLKNMRDIANIKSSGAVLDEFGIKVVGQESSVANMPTVEDYKLLNPEWAYGDAYAIGTEAPYALYILTREDANHESDYWFDIGEFPAPGPEGPQGPRGETGPQGQTGPTGQDGASAGFGIITASATTLEPGSAAQASVTAAGPDTSKNFIFTFGIPKGEAGEAGASEWGDIGGDISDQTDLVTALQGKQNILVSGTNIKTINNTSILGSGNIDIQSAVWGNITGTLSNQTDLQTALNAKANQNTTYTKTEVDTALNTKQDAIADLSAIRAGAAAGATAVQPAAIANMVTTTGEQTISGDKTFSGKLNKNANGFGLVLPGTTSNIQNKTLATTDQIKDVYQHYITFTANSGKTAIATKLLTQGNTPMLASDFAQYLYDAFADSTGGLEATGTIELSNVNHQYVGKLGRGSSNNSITVYPITSTGGYGNAITLAANIMANFVDVVERVGSHGGGASGGSITGQDVINALGYVPSHVDPNPQTTTATLNSIGIDGVNYAIAGGGGGTITDVEVNGTSVVSGGVANIDLSGYALTSSLADVATTGSYNDLINKPTIPAAQVNSDWNAVSGVAQILNKPNLATVATSGSYNDLTNKPSIPTKTSDLTNDSGFITPVVYGNISIKKRDSVANGLLVFNSNNIAATTYAYDHISRTNGKISIPNKTGTMALTSDIPTKVSDLTNDSGFITSAAIPTNYVTTDTAQTITGDKIFVGGISIKDPFAQDAVQIVANTGGVTIDTRALYIENNKLVATTDQIPTKVSDLTNDSGFITSSALSGYATEAWVGQQGYLTSVSWSDVSDKPTFATVATSGSYNDLSDKPTIPDLFEIEIGTEDSGTLTAEQLARLNLDPKTVIIKRITTLGELYYKLDKLSTPIGIHSLDSYIFTSIDNIEHYTYLSISINKNTGAWTKSSLSLASEAYVNDELANLATVATTGDYNDLTNKPDIPTNVSDLTNDSGFITSSALSGYATEAWVGQQGYQTASDVSTAIAGQTKETWTFTLSDGTTTTKTIVLG